MQDFDVIDCITGRQCMRVSMIPVYAWSRITGWDVPADVAGRLAERFGSSVTWEWDEISECIRGYVGPGRMVAKLIYAREKDGCPKCGARPEFVRTALVCRSHGVIGGF